MAKKLKKTRWATCNLLQPTADARRLWTFNAGKNGFNLNQQQTIPAAQPLPVKVVGRDWKTLLQPKLSIAWLPMEQVFLRVIQLPVSELAETMAMVELQLEKLSPLPVTQIVWTMQVLPQPMDNLQTIIVVMVSRDLVDKLLGELETQGFLADRLEFPLLDQLLATSIKADGAYIYPDKTSGKSTALVAWWYGGSLRSLGLVNVPDTENRADLLKEQLAQMAWSGELEGWLQATPQWHLVADEATAKKWQPMFLPWLGQSVEVIAPLPDAELAILNANRAARAEGTSGILPPEYTARYNQEFHDRLWMRGLFSLVAVYCFGVMIYLALASWQSYKADALVLQMNSASRQYTNTMQLKAQLEILQSRQDLKFASLDCWKATAEALPEGVTLQSLDFKEGKLNLNGTAVPEQREHITDFNDSLRKKMLNGQPMFTRLDAATEKLGPGGSVSWGFSGDLAHVEDVK